MTFECKECKRDYTYEPFYKFEDWTSNHEEYMRWLENTEGMCFNCYSNKKHWDERYKIWFENFKMAIKDNNSAYLERAFGITIDKETKEVRPMTREEKCEKIMEMEIRKSKSKDSIYCSCGRRMMPSGRGTLLDKHGNVEKKENYFHCMVCDRSVSVSL